MNTENDILETPSLPHPFELETLPVVAMNYDEMTVRDLKTQAMTKASALGQRKSWIQTCSKDDLVTYLKTGYIPLLTNGIAPEVTSGSARNANTTVPAVNGDLASILAQAIAPFIGNLTQKVDESDVIRIVEERLENFRTPKLIQVQDLQGRLSVPDLQHKLFYKVLLYASQRKNMYLVGPAGSGKTQVCEAVAAHLGLSFGAKSVCQQTPVSDFFGYMDAMGNYVETEFFRAYKNGGLFLFDEFDNGNANTAAAINMATSNGVCAFPCGMVKKHKDFICLAAGNTYGTGADRKYVGRNQLDAATLDRFAFIIWNYDEDLELAICPNAAWTKHVQAIRHTVEKLKLSHVVSMRASMDGGVMLAAGLPWIEAEEEYIWKGLSRSEVAKVVSSMAQEVI